MPARRRSGFAPRRPLEAPRRSSGRGAAGIGQSRTGGPGASCLGWGGGDDWVHMVGRSGFHGLHRLLSYRGLSPPSTPVRARLWAFCSAALCIQRWKLVSPPSSKTSSRVVDCYEVGSRITLREFRPHALLHESCEQWQAAKDAAQQRAALLWSLARVAHAGNRVCSPARTRARSCGRRGDGAPSECKGARYDHVPAAPRRPTRAILRCCA